MSDKFKSQLETEIADMAYGQDIQPNLKKGRGTKRNATKPTTVNFGALSAYVSVVSLFVVIFI